MGHPSQSRRRRKKNLRRRKKRRKKKRRRNKLFSAATEVSAPTEGRDRSNVSSPTLFVSHHSCCSKLSPPVASCCSGFFAPSIFHRNSSHINFALIYLLHQCFIEIITTSMFRKFYPLQNLEIYPLGYCRTSSFHKA